ncbi:MAG: caspase family protein [Desulfobacterales bacterium]|jgi:uncharacterized caspase-like protein
MDTFRKWFNASFTLIVLSLFLCPAVLAKTFQWNDYREPFTQEFRVATAVDIMVNLPAPLLEERKELTMIVEHKGLGDDGTGILRGLLSVNKQSFWKTYSFGNGEFTYEPIRLALKITDLKPGENKLHFTLHRGGNTISGWFTITELRFELPEKKKSLTIVERAPPPSPSDKMQPQSPKTQVKKDASPSANSQRTSRPKAQVKKTTPLSESGRQTPSGGTRAPSEVSSKTIVPSQFIDFGNFHALVIGNNNYQNINKLKTAVNDAKAVANILKTKYKFKVTLLLNATREHIFTAFAGMRRELQDTDNFLIYYAGHGIMDKETQRGYWLPVNAERRNKANWIANEDITGELKAIKAKHVLVIADSCFSGTLTRGPDIGFSKTGDLEEWVRRMAQRRSRTVLTSGGLEPVQDEGSGGHSVFANAFLLTLKDNHEIIDMDSLYEKIRRRVVLNARQTPIYSDIRFAGHDDGDFILVPR